MFIDPDNLVCGGIPGGGLDVLRALFHYFPVQFLIRAEMDDMFRHLVNVPEIRFQGSLHNFRHAGLLGNHCGNVELGRLQRRKAEGLRYGRHAVDVRDGEEFIDFVLVQEAGEVEFVSTAFGSLAMMTSVLVSPDGKFEFEAAHGTVTRHYYKYLKGEATSTNPMATIFAWSGALKKRGELDSLPDLVRFGEALEAASLQTLNDGIMTKDLCGLAEGITPTPVDSLGFIRAIRERLEKKF